MAPTRGGLKGFYRQRKKPKPAPKKKPKNAQPQQDGVAAGTPARRRRSPARSIVSLYLIISEEEYGAEEEALRQFDMDTSYGPCIGVTRLRRWDRAAAMGLRPPPHVRDLILRRHHHGDGDVGGSSSFPPKKKISSDSSSQLLDDDCLWAGKV
uniref:DNA polymerase delta subunit 4 n=1 Tax=Setaria viridis TaxID=4556 RepID=A0A4U6ULP0_SETVI|nr:hypothetical protein SEVIR_6G240700v2 [Setaria viridis]